MTDLQMAFQAIHEQQEKMQKYSPAYCLGEQLKGILSENPAAASLVLEDFKNPGMNITDCEKKIAEFAKAHKVGNCGCCPPQEADRIIREFYGIPTSPAPASLTLLTQEAHAAAHGAKPKATKVNLAAFLK